MRLITTVLLLFGVGCARPALQTGVTSWYGPGFRGKPTASGAKFRPGRRTAAHRTLPFGTVLQVTRVDTGRSVRVVVNDRGPFVDGRILDLSRRAARRIDMLDDGVTVVEVRLVGCRKRLGGCDLTEPR
jgi:rare lipoprotein A